MRRSDITWAFPQPEPNPYQVEWDDLIHAIRKDKLYNEVKRGAEASLVTSMGRMAAHTGQVITFSTAHSRQGPDWTALICDLPDGSRCYARLDEPLAEDVDLVGAPVTLAPGTRGATVAHR